MSTASRLAATEDVGIGTKPRALARREPPAVVYWAWLGTGIAVLMALVFFRWFLSGHMVPTNPGPDVPSPALLTAIFWVQIGAVGIGIAVFAWFVILPWLRERRVSLTTMLYFAWLTMFFQDPMMNYTSTTLLYNSYMVNLGSWTLGAAPGWLSPAGNQLPEPLLLIIVGYTIVGYSLCFPVLAILNTVKARYPSIRKISLAIIGILLLMLLDLIIEALLLRTGFYAYPYGIRELTLFADETYQFPLTEAIFYGGLTVGTTLMLLLFRDDKGQTFVERGIDTLRISNLSRQWVKFLALLGFVHASMFIFFTLPMQWFALHSDAFPQGYPSYMLNGLCQYGINQDQCPGPGVMLPRPDHALGH